MVQYVNDALPAICQNHRLYWDRSQLTDNQLVLHKQGRFYTNLKPWNLFTENQINLFNRMTLDEDGISRWALHYPFGYPV